MGPRSYDRGNAPRLSPARTSLFVACSYDPSVKTRYSANCATLVTRIGERPKSLGLSAEVAAACLGLSNDCLCEHLIVWFLFSWIYQSERFIGIESKSRRRWLGRLTIPHCSDSLCDVFWQIPMWLSTADSRLGESDFARSVALCYDLLRSS